MCWLLRVGPYPPFSSPFRSLCLLIVFWSWLVLVLWWWRLVLTHLVCKSLTEDTYGLVQPSIPRILEALLAYLTSIEEYTAELRTLMPPKHSLGDVVVDPVEWLRNERRREEVERALGEIGGVGEGELLLPFYFSIFEHIHTHNLFF